VSIAALSVVWTAGEQLFFADKHLKNEPKRCKACKATRESQLATGMPAHQRVGIHTTCSICGNATTVPFRPTQGSPVFCRECFEQRKAGVGLA
jgi:CxxC-x17-CxxC domain-containing protein